MLQAGQCPLYAYTSRQLVCTYTTRHQQLHHGSDPVALLHPLVAHPNDASNAPAAGCNSSQRHERVSAVAHVDVTNRRLREGGDVG